MGKACTEDTFDVATARNGFSGIRSLQALGLSEEKGCSTPTPRGRRCDAWAGNRGGDRGQASHRAAMHVVSAAVATAENGSSSEPRCMRGVHAFLNPGEAATRRAAGSKFLPEEDEKTRDWRDRTPERRPARPPAIKSPIGEKRVGQKDRTMGQIHIQGAVGCSHSWAVCRQPLQRPDNVWPRLALLLTVEIAFEAITTNRRRKAELILL
ncbi:hypothetical protein Esi_0216_0057 [Ectocarpus siliculosus]|uniref:Uncharacterized protein n=1 Tax=Ectocarpus siliculosus TaxID=2880 RepID=D7FRN6_ECTSI|nr:hypothetical protein Esi_0216_0057 [Ectocarpus siliculosus]|eukprot:CBJ30827.1 hypothetical protein Esi_0216_0057 [Ectocarpus siliculosus]